MSCFHGNKKQNGCRTVDDDDDNDDDDDDDDEEEEDDQTQTIRIRPDHDPDRRTPATKQSKESVAERGQGDRAGAEHNGGGMGPQGGIKMATFIDAPGGHGHKDVHSLLAFDRHGDGDTSSSGTAAS